MDSNYVFSTIRIYLISANSRKTIAAENAMCSASTVSVNISGSSKAIMIILLLVVSSADSSISKLSINYI